MAWFGTFLTINMDLIYNCGSSMTLNATAKSGRKYTFRKRYVTEIENKEDANYFLKKTSNDIGWCSKNSKDIPPFMTLEDWCAGKEGRFSSQPFIIYTPDGYKRLFLLK